MRRIKKGDIIRCIDVNHLIIVGDSLLTIGKDYKVINVHYDGINGPDIVYVLNDSGYEDHYRMRRFILVCEVRRETIDEILS